MKKILYRYWTIALVFLALPTLLLGTLSPKSAAQTSGLQAFAKIVKANPMAFPPPPSDGQELAAYRTLEGALNNLNSAGQIEESPYLLRVPKESSGQVDLMSPTHELLGTTNLYTYRIANNRKITYTIFTFPTTNESCIFAGTLMANDSALKYSGDVYCRSHIPGRMAGDINALLSSQQIHLQYNPNYVFNSTFAFTQTPTH